MYQYIYNVHNLRVSLGISMALLGYIRGIILISYILR